MTQKRKEIGKLLVKAIATERSAIMQYEVHALRVRGLGSEPVVARLEEITNDEHDHQESFMELASDFLDADLDLSPGSSSEGFFEFQPSPAMTVPDIIADNLKREKEGIDLYRRIREIIHAASPVTLPFAYDKLDHEIQHIIIDEQEHVVELHRLL
jgi:rubrerythrin